MNGHDLDLAALSKSVGVSRTRKTRAIEAVGEPVDHQASRVLVLNLRWALAISRAGVCGHTDGLTALVLTVDEPGDTIGRFMDRVEGSAWDGLWG